MKKVFCIFMVFLMIFCMTSCNNSKNENTNTENKVTTQADTPETIREQYLSVLKNQQVFYSVNKESEMLISDYNKGIWQFSFVDMDTDNIGEIAIMFDDGNILILRKDGDEIYGFDFGSNAMYQINSDGSFFWKSDSGNVYGCSTLMFTGKEYKITELWRVETDNAGAVNYYIDGESVSQENFQSVTVQSNKESVAWNAWETIDTRDISVNVNGKIITGVAMSDSLTDFRLPFIQTVEALGMSVEVKSEKIYHITHNNDTYVLQCSPDVILYKQGNEDINLMVPPPGSSSSYCKYEFDDVFLDDVMLTGTLYLMGVVVHFDYDYVNSTLSLIIQ